MDNSHGFTLSIEGATFCRDYLGLSEQKNVCQQTDIQQRKEIMN